MEVEEYNPVMAPEEKQQVQDVCLKWPMAFANGSNNLGRGKKYKMKVELKIEITYPEELKKNPTRQAHK